MRPAAHILLILTLWAMSGCILSPPVEAETPTNRAPYLNEDDALPQERVVVLTDPVDGEDRTVQLSMNRLYDPDDEAQLYYAWYSPRLGLLDESSVGRVSAGEAFDAFGTYYAYGGSGVRQIVNPCDPRLLGVAQETVWLYVSDEDWSRTGAEGVEEQPGAFKVSYAWVLDLSQITCQ